ncbi:ABC transporter ATP-binding protein [Novosphingobium resinovorum]|uniref:ABC transporter ATP-binding protein n=1 Tax=Novosphingobium resinovorum TaxID=158500 RepID=UPI002ED0AE19|nr:ABC transporter ATP-binding protein [Novosphingobium resinovorum]
MEAKHLIVEGLSVSFGARRVVEDVSFELPPGKVVALVGESGSGKSVTARSLVGLAGPGAHVEARRFSYGEHDLLRLPERAWRRLRGKDIGFVLQDALVSLDPLRPVGKEVLEPLALHGWGTRAGRKARVLELLEQAGVPEPQLRAGQRSGQLSGGLRQRALIASALALGPGLIIADEPTTALDATVQARILDLFEEIRAAGSSLLLISHDLGVVSRLADEVLVMHQGRVVEQGPIAQILAAPRHPYTRSLLDARPGLQPARTRLGPGRPGPVPVSGPVPFLSAMPQMRLPEIPLLEARQLGKRYRGPDRRWRQVIEGIDITLHAGRTVGIVGESGSGKSTAARIVMGLLEPDAGEVTFAGEPWSGPAGARVPEHARRPRRRHISAIYQDPLSSFDPRWNVGQILEDALAVGGCAPAKRRDRVATLLEQVRLPADLFSRGPLQLSGGQRQRVAIARAIASNPKVIVCDEPVSALDVSVQAQVLDLLAELQEQLGLAYLFISHDLDVIRHVSDELLVMSQGRIVERGSTRRIFEDPRHPYTRQLLAAVPRLPQEAFIAPLVPEYALHA